MIGFDRHRAEWLPVKGLLIDTSTSVLRQRTSAGHRDNSNPLLNGRLSGVHGSSPPRQGQQGRKSEESGSNEHGQIGVVISSQRVQDESADERTSNHRRGVAQIVNRQHGHATFAWDLTKELQQHPQFIAAPDETAQDLHDRQKPDVLREKPERADWHNPRAADP